MFRYADSIYIIYSALQLVMQWFRYFLLEHIPIYRVSERRPLNVNDFLEDYIKPNRPRKNAWKKTTGY